MAARYGVAASTVVVVAIAGGKEQRFRRLDDVWTRHDQPAAFNQYAGGAIRDLPRGLMQHGPGLRLQCGAGLHRVPGPYGHAGDG